MNNFLNKLCGTILAYKTNIFSLVYVTQNCAELQTVPDLERVFNALHTSDELRDVSSNFDRSKFKKNIV
jgi:hypothetical protein